MSEDDLSTVVNAMERVEIPSGADVITQGMFCVPTVFPCFGTRFIITLLCKELLGIFFM